ncbi:MAG: tetratricopeptide repeat protein [Candidatus Latescibacteria bacterium]|nr:tetratricopeptide repeat protein [Candidatus Latescibacterota bacterium]
MSEKSKKITYGLLAIFIIAVILYVFLPNFSTKELVIVYPKNNSLFPPEISPAKFCWNDSTSGADMWNIEIQFANGGKTVTGLSSTTEWTPAADKWETIKENSLEKSAIVTIKGYKSSFFGKIMTRNKTLSENTVTISTSADSVGAPIFYRDVPLPFDFAREKMELIQWRMGDVSKSERPPIVLENLPVCGNCHSFTPDGATLAMDVDSGGDKGSYAITPVEEHIFLTREKLITWNDYKRDDGNFTFGLLAQISPDGRYVTATVKDRVIFLGKNTDITFSQLFFPVKGIVGIYDRETKKFFSLPGADDPDFVQSNPVWSPDGKYIIFARAPMTEFLKNDKTKNIVLTRGQSAVVLGGEQYIEDTANAATFAFDLYRIPFNEGKGGTPEPIRGASNNGKSNYFARYSPDGKWIVFCQARSFMLLQPDSKLCIMPADFSEEPREMKYNTGLMNSWHSWSPNCRWIVFSSKENSPYTDLFIKHIDENGKDSPPILLHNFSSNDRARNIPEFVNIASGGIQQIEESFVDYYSYTRRGDKLKDYGKFDEAEKSFRISIDMNPDFIDAHRELAYLLRNMNRIDEAEEEFKIALKLDPDDPLSHLNLGEIYLGRGEYEKAEKFFRTSVIYDSKYAPAYQGLGLIQLAKGDTKEAKENFERAIKLDPDLPDTHYNLGVIYMGEKDFEKARESFELVLRYKTDIDTYLRLGTIHLYDKEYDKAEDRFKTALRIDSQNPQALHNLGIIYMNKKEFDKAENAFRHAHKLDPNNPNACFMLAKVLSMKNNTVPEAISMYIKGLDIMPLNIQGYIDLGNLYLKIGNKASAIQEFEKALRLNPEAQQLRVQIDRLKQQL